MKLFVAILLSALLAACSVAPQNPQQAVYQIRGNYNVALTIAVAYKALPRCGLPTSPVLCAKESVIADLQQADYVAFPALKAAENIVRTPGSGVNPQTAIYAAEQAVYALTAITSKLKVSP